MKVFDFDNTLYHGESSIDFAIYMIKVNKRIILWLPKIFWNLVKYKLCLVTKVQMEREINKALKVLIRSEEEVLGLTSDFWKKHRRKLDRSLIRRIDKDDVIITAGPSFLLGVIRNELGTEHMICSEVDLRKRRISYLNFSDNKVSQYHRLYSNTPIDSFYTDSFNDKAMMDISRKVFIVKKGRIKRIK